MPETLTHGQTLPDGYQAGVAAVVAAIEAVHRRQGPGEVPRANKTFGFTGHAHPWVPERCEHCKVAWPCPTIEALAQVAAAAAVSTGAKVTLIEEWGVEDPNGSVSTSWPGEEAWTRDDAENAVEHDGPDCAEDECDLVVRRVRVVVADQVGPWERVRD